MNKAQQPSSGENIRQTLGLSSTGRKPFWKYWYVWAALAGLILIGAPFLLGPEEPQTVRYRTETVSRGNLAVTVTATGNLAPTNEVEVGSELSGTVESVAVDYNDQVKVGQVLAKLDVSKLNAQVLQSKASLESAKANVLEAQATVKNCRSDLARLQKVRELSGGKVPSPQDLDSAEADLARAMADEAAAQAAVLQAQATLEENQTDLGKAVIVSPVNGIVLTRSVEPGQTVAASLEAPVLFTLAEDLAHMELQVDVDEADVGSVKTGQDAVFTVDAYPSRTFPARTVQVRYGADETDGVVTYKTILNVDNPDLALRPGMTATADIRVQKKDNAVLIPNAALRFTPATPEPAAAPSNESLFGKLMPHPPARPEKKQAVTQPAPGRQNIWVLRNDQPTPIEVTTGITDGLKTEIVDGPLEPGMAVITGTLDGN